MTSEAKGPREAYVWVWLPGEVEPRVAGLVTAEGDRLVFNYGRSYLADPRAIPLYLPELPLQRGLQEPLPGLTVAGCLRDAAPDAWGRRVIVNRVYGSKGQAIDIDRLDELTYMLESGSDRIGALDFQASATAYLPRAGQAASLEELLTAAERVEQNIPLTPDLEVALRHGTSVGGARPKAAIDDADRKLIAKFSSTTDHTNVVKAEFIAMRLASAVGLTVAPVHLVHVAGKDVLLVERFDRIKVPGGWQRRALVSALTLQGLHELLARYASYETLAGIVRQRFTAPKQTLRELFSRLVFNLLCGNTDDHARNHAAFWDGTMLTLTPAYDICPQIRSGNMASQGMRIVGEDGSSRLATCLQAAPSFLLSPSEAMDIMAAQVETLAAKWPEVCEEAAIGAVDRSLLIHRAFLNPYLFEGAPTALQALQSITLQ